jgi:predicted PhzF superfamily epimerase YddE/YHI9
VQTGSAHCALIPYYLQQASSTFSTAATDKLALSVQQQSKQTGEMVVQWLKDAGRVRIFGQGVEVGKGEIEI